MLFVSPFSIIYPKILRCGEYLSERAKRGRRTKALLPLQMKWLCGWMYMRVRAARSSEWEVGTEWEEKSCFGEMICTEACWKAVTLSWLLFVSCGCTKTDVQVFLFVPAIICVYVWGSGTAHLSVETFASEERLIVAVLRKLLDFLNDYIL